MRLFFRLCTAIVLIIAFPVTAAHASTDDFEFESYHADYSLTRDDDGRSRMLTVETLVALFPEEDVNRGVQRAIPSRYKGQNVDLQVHSVTDEEGQEREFTTSRDGDFTIVEVAVPEGEYEHGRTTYVIEYEQRDVVQHFADTAADELYWDVNGTGWAQPFKEVSATLQVDEELVPALSGEAACYRGPEGSNDSCDISADGGTLHVAEAGLGAHENVTVAVGFAEGTFEMPPPLWWEANDLFVPGAYAAGGAGLLSIVVSLVAGFRNGRHNEPLIARYTPPSTLGVAPASHIEGKPKTMSTAVLLDLAVRGNLRITHDEYGNRFGAQQVHRDGLVEVERDFMRDLFRGSGDDKSVWFTKQSTKLGDAAHKLRRTVDRQVRSSGFRREPSQRLRKFGVLLIAAGFALFAIYRFTSGTFTEVVFPLAIAVVAFFVITKISGAIASRQQPLTVEGARMRNHLRGLKLYIELAEKDRLAMLQSSSGAQVDEQQVVQVYEQLLPYAVIFGLETQWHGELAKHYRQVTPTWVDDPRMLRDAAWANQLDRQVRKSRVSRSLARSSGSRTWGGSASFSSSGGSRGGGFSGGGRGGGGGRGI